MPFYKFKTIKNYFFDKLMIYLTLISKSIKKIRLIANLSYKHIYCNFLTPLCIRFNKTQIKNKPI